jgi:hypothetical protein
MTLITFIIMLVCKFFIIKLEIILALSVNFCTSFGLHHFFQEKETEETSSIRWANRRRKRQLNSKMHCTNGRQKPQNFKIIIWMKSKTYPWRACLNSTN